MKTLQAQVPELLLQEVQELAVKQNATVDQIVSVALAAQVSAWRTRESIASRTGQKQNRLLDIRSEHQQIHDSAGVEGDGQVRRPPVTCGSA
jgi:homospermidine synthase